MSASAVPPPPLTAAAGSLLDVAERLNDPQTRAALLALLEGVSELHRSGALATLLETAQWLHAARNALTDGMVERLAGLVEQIVGLLADGELAAVAEDAKQALREAAANPAANEKGGLMATLNLLGKAETQQTLRFILGFGHHFQQQVSIRTNPENPE
ncbi:MAG: hypothetical protein K2Q10_08475 [Rhodospirillales bacterium]|nr:hypothetical protein [Rhodospirillales bacterium]